jgi:two-component system, OmpR family, response regulator
MRLLIVEDDALLADGLARSLRRSGHAVDWVESAERAWLALESEAFDLAILDLGLPGGDGFDLLHRLRRNERYIPVIIATAREAVADRVRGLDLGADDYLVKPFAIEELEARVRALIRRRSVGTPPEIRCGDLVLDLAVREARLAGRPVDLTKREWAILELLITQPGVAIAKERLMQSLSSWDDRLTLNAVEVYVSRLRTKIEAAGVKIRTVRGFGYIMEPPVGK